MTDNVSLVTGDPATPPSGTAIATDNIGGVNYQRVKVVWDVDGTATDASATDPLPVTGTLTVNAGTGTWPVSQSGTWNVTNISGTVSLPTGAATAAKQPALGTAGTASTDVISVQGIASMTALKVDGSAVTQPTSSITNAASGGIASTSRIVSAAASTNATNAKASAGRIYSIQLYNAATTIRYLKLYNKASAPTVGSDAPVKTIPLPPSTGMILDWGNIGYSFSTGISYALTTGSADADTGALTSGDVLGLGIDYV